MTSLKERTEVYKVVGDTIMKLVFALISAAIFAAVSIKLIIEPSWPVAAADSFFSITVTIVFKHYFPASNPPRARTTKTKATKAAAKQS